MTYNTEMIHGTGAIYMSCMTLHEGSSHETNVSMHSRYASSMMVFSFQQSAKSVAGKVLAGEEYLFPLRIDLYSFSMIVEYFFTNSPLVQGDYRIWLRKECEQKSNNVDSVYTIFPLVVVGQPLRLQGIVDPRLEVCFSNSEVLMTSFFQPEHFAVSDFKGTLQKEGVLISMATEIPFSAFAQIVRYVLASSANTKMQGFASKLCQRIASYQEKDGVFAYPNVPLSMLFQSAS